MSAAKHLAPALENGAVMTREEFHRLYAECEGYERVELIEGVVFMPSPVRFESHDKQASLLRGWLFVYSTLHEGIESGNEATLILGDSEVQPDAFLLHAGTVPIDEDGYLTGAPPLVAEVAASTASRDLHSKRNLYERSGVREYIVWRTLDGAIDWFVMRDGVYALKAADERGMIESEQFPGLVMDVPAMLAMDRKAVLAALRG
jgi:Uma2 family endonuclease